MTGRTQNQQTIIIDNPNNPGGNTGYPDYGNPQYPQGNNYAQYNYGVQNNQNYGYNQGGPMQNYDMNQGPIINNTQQQGPYPYVNNGSY